MTMLNVKIEFHIYIHKDVAVNSLQPSSMQNEPAVEQKEPLKRIASLSLSEYARRQARLAFRKGRFSTPRNYLTALRSFLRFHEGQDIPLSELTASLVADYERWLKANCKSMGTWSTTGVRPISASLSGCLLAPWILSVAIRIRTVLMYFRY